MTSATHPLILDQSFAYDPVGNRTTGGSQHNAGNQLTADASFTYQYDDNGNLSRKTITANGNYTQYTYDAENRLTQVQEFTFGNPTPVATSTYRYDGLGRRIEKVGNGQTRRYVYDREDILLEYNGANQLLARYTHGQDIDEPIAVTRGGNTFFYHADGLGTITELTDGSGATAQSYTYDSFGNLIEQTGTFENPYTYAGRELDTETGLYYYRARYFDSAIGRFLQKDPLNLAGGDVNLYAYVGSNATNYIDPRGLLKADPNDRVGPLDKTIVCDGKGNIIVYVPKDNFAPIKIECGVYDCFVKHEETHRSYARAQKPDVCFNKPLNTKVTPSDPDEKIRGEIEGYSAQLQCLIDKLKKAPPCCEDVLTKEIEGVEKRVNFFKGQRK